MARNGHGAKPEHIRERILDSLLTGKSAKAIASELSIDEKTVDRLLKDGDFRAELMSRSRAISDAAMALMTSANRAAVGKILTLINSDDPKVALRASELTLNISQRWVTSDTEQRLLKLEEIINEIKPES